MPKLTIKMKNGSFLKPSIFVNQKEVMMKKKNGFLVGSVDCDTKAQIKIENYHPLNEKFGMIFAYLFFLISILGIFDNRYPNKEKRISFAMDLFIYEDKEINIKYLKFSPNQPAIEIEGIENYTILENEYIKDENLKKKIRWMRLLKIGTWLIALVLLILFLINLPNIL